MAKRVKIGFTYDIQMTTTESADPQGVSVFSPDYLGDREVCDVKPKFK